MADIVKTSVTGSGQKAVTVTTLGASDTLVFKDGVDASLVLNNVTAGALTPLIQGADAITENCKGLLPFDTSVGLTLTSIGIGDTVIIPLDSISAYLKGIVTVTGGDGIEAQLLEYS